MNSFVVKLPLILEPQTDDNYPARLKRLRARGWKDVPMPDNVIGATRGRAEAHRQGTSHFVGTALLNNRAEILDRLATNDRGCDLDAHCSDFALLAAAYRTGQRFHEWIRGAFAFVVLDSETGTLAGYRDHFGQFPLYYCMHSDHLTCGTDLRATLHLSCLPITPEPQKIVDFVAGREVDPTLTAFSGLRRLPAAHRLSCQETLKITRYWAPELPQPLPALGAGEGLREKLSKATDSLVENYEQLGAMLSGGLDSSTLVGLVARARHARNAPALPTISLTHASDRSFDEKPYIDAINAAHHTAPRPIPVTEAPDLSQIDHVIEEQMDLFLGFAIQKSRRLYLKAKSERVQILIDGHGGDEVISHGYERLAALASGRHWGALWFALRGASRIYGTGCLGPYLLYIARYSGLRQNGILRRGLRRLGNKLARTDLGDAHQFQATQLIAPRLQDAQQLKARYAQPRPPQERNARLTYAQEAHLRTLCDPGIEHSFEVLYRAAQSCGVTPHYPFFDKDVVEYCLALPPEVKLKGGVTRWVLRDAIRGIVPDQVRLRHTKADFTEEFIATMRGFLADHPAPDLNPLSDVIDVKAASRLFARAGQLADSDIETWRALWRLVVLAYWWAAQARWSDQQDRGELL